MLPSLAASLSAAAFTEHAGIWIGVAAGVALAVAVAVRLGLRAVVRRAARWIGQRYMLLSVVGERDLMVSRAVEWLMYLLIGLAAVLTMLALLGVDVSPAMRGLRGIGAAIGSWLGIHGARIVIIVGLAYASSRLLQRFVPTAIRTEVLRDKEEAEREEAAKRANTLTGVASSVGSVLIFVIASFMILAEVGFNLAPILAGFGLVALAVGFGAQYLVRDIISGIFILLEDQYRKGDVASVGGKTGLVESVNLRRTVLRDQDGIVHIIPNGEIGVASNYTKTFSRVNLNVGVAYKEDLDKVFAVLNRVGRELAEDKHFSTLITEAPQVVWVNEFADSAIMIKMVGVTRPIYQWEVTGELRRRIKKAFDQEGIEIPFPHRTIYWGVDARPGGEPPLLPRDDV